VDRPTHLPHDDGGATVTDPTAVRDLAQAGYVYGYATVDLYRILDEFALDPTSPAFKAPLNAFSHARSVADATDRTIVAMNVDTPYSYAWLDLRAGPVLLTVPPFEAERYVSAQLFDLYTYIVGYVSPRTTGNGGGRYLITGPGWTGDTAEHRADDIDHVFRCPTDLALVLARTQLFDATDVARVHAIQDGLGIVALADAGVASPPALQPIPPVDVRTAPDLRFFDVLGWMLELMPELDEDRELRHRLASIGIGPGTVPSDLDESTRAALLDGMVAGARQIGERAQTVRSSAEIFGSREHFAGDHLRRACGAMLGILGNSAEEYLGVGYQGDAEGQPFDGADSYEITFAPDALPPVDAFWSITLYDADRFLYANEIGRHVIGSRQLPELARDPDGGVTLTISTTAPSDDRRANLLPCPPGPFHLAFRTYLPRSEIRDGEWVAPPVRRRSG
jgi:hypothetical protein